MTSNIGAQYLLEGIDEKGEIAPDAENAVLNELRAHFRPEFLNRLDEIIMFKPLTKDNISKIVDLILADINRRLRERDITIELTEAAKSFVTENGYEPMYGARPLKRYVQKHVETLAAKVILGGDISQGDIIIIDCADNKLIAGKK